MGRLADNRQRINRDLRDPEQRRLFSPALYADFQRTVPAIREHTRGNVIDIGCGDLPYSSIIVQKAERYDTIDIERRVPEVKFLGNVEKMEALADAEYDPAICLDVLEHVPHPFTALGEIHRVLRPGGTLVLTVPHLSRLHEEPHDYFRYTKHGLRSALSDAGFDVLSVTPTGGLFSFLGHQTSTALLCSVWHVPGLRQAAFFLNSWLSVRLCHLLDQVFDKQKLFALGYLAVAKKR